MGRKHNSYLAQRKTLYLSNESIAVINKYCEGKASQFVSHVLLEFHKTKEAEYQEETKEDITRIRTI